MRQVCFAIFCQKSCFFLPNHVFSFFQKMCVTMEIPIPFTSDRVSRNSYVFLFMFNANQIIYCHMATKSCIDLLNWSDF